MERTDDVGDTGGVRPEDVEAVPEADQVEQMTPVVGEDEGDEPDEIETPLEVNEADAAEQRRSVPDDEDYPRG
ncbi:hypothetical protein ERC79_18850 [Rhodococcus sp. ABRD24]|uniref:hypothetical protein n=1 Tax=Rhodococcus sp. ABRD24 TaxID=2507582 RepID=UPI00103F3613|nr:hypothetical protein [Rhodococcus sp. ABRD24]QBJ97767.1 hypothetical protein ERC79_18850 [Rhodococcus sp. ABRD24]